METENLSPHSIDRLNTELNEVEKMDKNSVRLEFPENNNKLKFFVYIKVSEGIYKDKWFKFSFVIPNDWPNLRPRVLIVNKIWHPNIGLVEDGHPEYGVVSVSTLDFYSQDTPLQMIIESLKYILINPNPNDPQNPDAGSEQISNYEAFKHHAYRYLVDMEFSDSD